MFHIRNYIWNVFQISSYQEVDIRTAFDMFIVNVELGLERYKGAIDINYRSLNFKWSDLDDEQKRYQKSVFDKIIRKNFLALHDLFIKFDKLGFNYLCIISR